MSTLLAAARHEDSDIQHTAIEVLSETPLVGYETLTDFIQDIGNLTH